MFCPKCGTQNPDSGRFCRSCGTDLSNVSDALAGNRRNNVQGFGMIEPLQPHELLGKKGKPVSLESALTKIFTGLAFLVISIVLAFTPMGRAWWFWMLIPAFTMLGSGIAQYLQIRKHESRTSAVAALPQSEPHKNFAPAPHSNQSLPPTQTEYVAPTETGYKTGDLIPPSVTEETTRHLEMNSEGETMTLPKR